MIRIGGRRNGILDMDWFWEMAFSEWFGRGDFRDGLENGIFGMVS